MSSHPLSIPMSLNHMHHLSCLLGGVDDGSGNLCPFKIHPFQMVPTDDASNGQSPALRKNEEFLNSEFNKLSVQEQSKALNDVHHAASELKEDPVMIDKLLTEFEQEVERGRYPIYEQALQQDRSYVEDPAFRLKFLRANMHDVRKAVKQMTNFLKHKAKYFGNDKVAADITIEDMTPHELKIMLSGLYHIQKDTDRNGRVIFHRFNRLVSGKFNTETMIRINYYIWFNILIPIHSVQKKGVLAICYDVMKQGETHSVPPMKAMLKLFDFMSCLPMRFSAIHFCLKRGEGNLDLRNLVLGLATQALPQHARERSMVHHGSHVELQYQLSTYGIPLDTFPVDANGNVRDSILNAWFYEHLEKHGGIKRLDTCPSGSGQDDGDEADDDASFVSGLSSQEDSDGASHRKNHAVPNTVVDGIWETDVLLGRGRLVQYHAGNINF